MSLFEWLGERSNPGPVGDVDVGVESVSLVWLPFTVVRFVLTLALFVATTIYAAFYDGTPNFLRGVIAAGAFLLYLTVGYFVRPRPDTTNMGYLGGLVDNPFRYSDDRNRNLMFFAIMLFPGYFLARPIVEIFSYIAGEADSID